MNHSMEQHGEHLEIPMAFAETISDVVENIIAAPHRIGQPGRERTPIPRELRRLVFMRDGFTCRWCGKRVMPRDVRQIVEDEDGAPFQLDHITPHAAGGCDHAHNLRVLCRGCNEWRSNYATDQYARVLPVTEECTPCQVSRLQVIAEAADWDCELPEMPGGLRLTAYCGTCRFVSWVHEQVLLL